MLRDGTWACRRQEARLHCVPGDLDRHLCVPRRSLRAHRHRHGCGAIARASRDHARRVLLFLRAIGPTSCRCGKRIRSRIAGLPIEAFHTCGRPSKFGRRTNNTASGGTMAKSQKVIITCAVTGSIHTPSMSPHIPVTASEIADAAIGAAEAGAAVVHLHARDPKDGRPDQSPEAFAPFLKVIKQSSKAVINITPGGAPTMAIEERVRPAATFKPEVASLNMGSMNFGLYPMLPRFKGKLKHAWEEPYLEGSRDRIFKNTFADIE